MLQLEIALRYQVSGYSLGNKDSNAAAGKRRETGVLGVGDTSSPSVMTSFNTPGWFDTTDTFNQLFGRSCATHFTLPRLIQAKSQEDWPIIWPIFILSYRRGAMHYFAAKD